LQCQPTARPRNSPLRSKSSTSLRHRCAHSSTQSAANFRYEGEPSFQDQQTQKERKTMSNTQSPDIPKWSALLVEAVNKPGLILEAYSAFHQYSIGNQLLALVQCHMRGIQPGPINTFPKWQALGRHVKRGERALILCMPITRKRRGEESNTNDETNGEAIFTSFVHRARWFVGSQTEGQELAATPIPQWTRSKRWQLSTLNGSTLTARTATVRGSPERDK
jgi:hypothetical protein